MNCVHKPCYADSRMRSLSYGAVLALSTALMQVTRKANCWEPSIPLNSSQHSCSPSVRRKMLTLGLYRIKISGLLSWIQYIPFSSLSFAEDLVQFLLRSFSLFMILKCKNYPCEWRSCSQQGRWQECTTLVNLWNSGQYSWLSVFLLMLHVCFTEVIKAQTNPCWLVQG